MEDTQESLDTIKFKMGTSSQNIQTLESEIGISTGSITNLTESIQTLDEVKNILTILKNQKMESKKEFILNTINTALNDVFSQGVKIDIEATSATSTGKINMKYDIVLYQNGIEMARNEKLLGNNGGGVLSFISILFKILVGYIYSDNKFFLFDEAISQVSPSYRPRLAKFLQQFCKEYEFTLVLVSQTDDIDEFADLVYLLDGEFDKDGIPVLKIDQIIGEYPKDKYVYSKIENFQSIVKLEFRYKGFTVIRGSNNIGKSASFRAVNALLFNTFDAKDHPRKKRPRGAETKILFGKVDSELDVENNTIGLTFKSNKVVYEFDDLTFTGKTLAFEKVKEKVESIGFKYVNLKDTYKNFKGNLKDQTERLAMTTQHDGFYLVGNKSSETEKVFNFLFDSTDVANAIANVSNDILIDTNQLNLLTDEIKVKNSMLVKAKLVYEIYIFKYYVYLILAHRSDISELDKDSNIVSVLTDTLANISSYVSITDGIVELNCARFDLEGLKSNNTLSKKVLLDELIGQIAPRNSILEYITEANSLTLARNRLIEINKFFDELKIMETAKQEIDAYQYYINAIEEFKLLLDNSSENKKLSLSIKIEKVKELIDDISNFDTITRDISLYEITIGQFDDLNEKQQFVANELSNNDKAFGITPCPQCQGSGFVNMQGAHIC